MSRMKLLFFAAAIFWLFSSTANAQHNCNSSDDLSKKNCGIQHMIYRDQLNAYVSQDYNNYAERYARNGNNGHHPGMDIVAPPGTAFRAVAGGYVVRVDNGLRWDSQKSVYVQHESVISIYVTNTANGIPDVHKYAHGENFTVHQGDYVFSGQILGYTACKALPGYCDAPHTHFEVQTSKGLAQDSSQVYQIAGIRGDSTDTSDPTVQVYSLRSDGGYFWTYVPQSSVDVVQGQSASFDVQVNPTWWFNTPLRFYANYLPTNIDTNQTKWSLTAVSTSSQYPATSRLTIKTTLSTPVGTQWIQFRTSTTDGRDYDYWAPLNVKSAVSNTGGDIWLSDMLTAKSSDSRYGSEWSQYRSFYSDQTWNVHSTVFAFRNYGVYCYHFQQIGYPANRWVEIYDGDSQQWRWFHYTN